MAMGSVGNKKKRHTRGTLTEERSMNTEVCEDPVLGALIHRAGPGKPQHFHPLGLPSASPPAQCQRWDTATTDQLWFSALLFFLFCVCRQVTEVLCTYSLAI